MVSLEPLLSFYVALSLRRGRIDIVAVFKSHRHRIRHMVAFPAVTGGGRRRVPVRALCYPSRVADVL